MTPHESSARSRTLRLAAGCAANLLATASGALARERFSFKTIDLMADDARDQAAQAFPQRPGGPPMAAAVLVLRRAGA